MFAGMLRCTEAKFQIAFMPASTILSATSCAAYAGTVMMPIWILNLSTISLSLDTSYTGLPLILVLIILSFLSNAATMFKP